MNFAREKLPKHQVEPLKSLVRHVLRPCWKSGPSEVYEDMFRRQRPLLLNQKDAVHAACIQQILGAKGYNRSRSCPCKSRKALNVNCLKGHDTHKPIVLKVNCCVSSVDLRKAGYSITAGVKSLLTKLTLVQHNP